MNILKHIFRKNKSDETIEPSVKNVGTVRPDAEKTSDELRQEIQKLESKILRTEAYIEKAQAAGHDRDAARFRAKKEEQEARLKELTSALENK